MYASDYKKLDVWCKSVELAKTVYLLVKLLPKEEIFALSDQMRRAAISVTSNIAEGHGRGYPQEFIRHLAIAKGSLCELETQCILAVETDLLNKAQIEPALKLCNEINRMLRSLIKYLEKL